MNNNVNVYALIKLRVLLNDNIFNDANKLNELIDLMKSNTGMEINYIDYNTNKVCIYKSGIANMAMRQICSAVCTFLNNHKLDIQISIDSIEREDEKREVNKLLNDLLIGNNVNMLVNIMDISNKENTILNIQL